MVRAECERPPRRPSHRWIRLRRVQLDPVGSIIARASRALVRISEKGAKCVVVRDAHLAERTLEEMAHLHLARTSSDDG